MGLNYFIKGMMIDKINFIQDSFIGRESFIDFRNIVLFIFIASAFTIAQEGRLIFDSFHSNALEGNLLGDSPKQNVIVYLPPSYHSDTVRQYRTL